jgi:hypothetical protein
MAKRKYEDLFISGIDPEIQAKRPYAAIAFLDGKTFEGCNEYHIYWIGDKPYGPYGSKKWGDIMHGPHTHKYPELIVHLGTDPDNPMDLGAEIEMCMGPEMEKYTFNKSTAICIPANFVHAPWRILKVTRPFLMVEVNQSPKHTEKSRKDIVTKEDLKRMLFVDVGYESDEMVMHWPEAAGPQPDAKKLHD